MKRKLLNIFKAICSVFGIVIGGLLLTESSNVSEMVVGAILIIMGICGIVSFFKYISTINNNTAHYAQEGVIRNNIISTPTITLKHVSGLPIRPGAICNIVVKLDKVNITSQGVTFIINKDKILDISIQKDISNCRQAVSSAGGALAGGLAFGVVGAAIGGRTKVKNIKSTNKYVVLTYNKDDDVSYIAFEYKMQAYALINNLKNFSKDTVSIEL